MHNVSPFYLHCASSGLYTLYVPQLCEYNQNEKLLSHVLIFFFFFFLVNLNVFLFFFKLMSDCILVASLVGFQTRRSHKKSRFK